MLRPQITPEMPSDSTAHSASISAMPASPPEAITGINIEATVKLARALSIPVIASGGLSDLADIERLCAVEFEGIDGVICGRSIYTGALDFVIAQARADELGAAA